MQPLRLCAFLAVIAVLGASGTSKNVLDFLSISSGDYDNKEQIQKPGNHHAFVQLRVIPVDVKCLRPNPVRFVEIAVNGAVTTLALQMVKDDIGNTVSEPMYIFTDITTYKPGQYNIENLSNISCRDLQKDEDCIGSSRVWSDGVVVEYFPECNVTVNQKHPRLEAVLKCESKSVTVPFDSEPYEFKLTSKKYPLINPPQDYVSPCDN